MYLQLVQMKLCQSKLRTAFDKNKKYTQMSFLQRARNKISSISILHFLAFGGSSHIVVKHITESLDLFVLIHSIQHTINAFISFLHRLQLTKPAHHRDCSTKL